MIAEFRRVTALAIALALFGCGGSGGGGFTQPLSGTAAVGAPMSAAIVTLKDAYGVTKTVIAGADGTFAFSDINSLTAPLMLKAEGLVDGVPAELYSALDTKLEDVAVVTNITPITNAIVTQLALGDPAGLFTAPAQLSSKITPAALSSAVAKIQVVLDNFNSQLGVSGTSDPFKTRFSADSTGLDKMLDLVRFEADVSGKMIITDKASGVVKSIQKTDAVSSITKLPAPSTSLVNLDFSKVTTLVSSMNQIAKGSGTWSDLMDAGFIHEGMSAVTYATLRSADSSDFTVQSYQFDGCNASTSVCEGNFNLKYKDGFMLPIYMPVKFANGAWKMFGDQRNFTMRFGQMVDVQISSSQTAPIAQDIRFGFDMAVQAQPFNNQGVQTPGANVFFSTNGKQTWSAVVWELVPLAGCDHLVLDGSTTCDSFIPANTLSSAMVTAMEQAFLNGEFWVRIDPKTGNTPARAEFRPRLRLYSEADRNTIREKLIASMNASARGKNEIPLLPNAEYVRLVVADSSNAAVFSVEFDVKNQTLQSVGNSITVTEACAPPDSSARIKILVNSARPGVCASPQSAKIKSVFQSIPNPGNPTERIRLSY